MESTSNDFSKLYSLEDLAKFCQSSSDANEILSAIRHLCPLPPHEQRAVLNDPQALLQLVNYHDIQETEGDAMGFDCSGNRIRRAQLKDMAKKIADQYPDCWPDQVLDQLGIPRSPPSPITAASIVAKMNDLLDDLSGLSNPKARRVQESLRRTVERYEALRQGVEVVPDSLSTLCAEVRALVEEYREVKSADLLTSMLIRAVEGAEKILESFAAAAKLQK
jgi:hypothetical protein